METLAIVLITIWLAGIVVLAAGTVLALKNKNTQDESVIAMQIAAETNPSAVALVMALIILIWPFALLHGALKKGVK